MKSTLINALVGEKVSIVSPKPQTTRNNIIGILNKPNLQIIFTDTPGIHQGNNKLDDYMEKSINQAKQGTFYHLLYNYLFPLLNRVEFRLEATTKFFLLLFQKS